ncbi:unnamed protein product [Ectocarpus sp. 8 AP-2014]
MGHVVALDATSNNSGSGEGAAEGGGEGGGGKAAAPAPVPQHLKQQKEKQQRVQAAEDSDAPILYIKGLKEGGGVGLWGSEDDDDDDNDSDNDSPARGGGNAAMMARALRNAEREIEGGGDYEEGVEEEGGGGQPGSGCEPDAGVGEGPGRAGPGRVELRGSRAGGVHHRPQQCPGGRVGDEDYQPGVRAGQRARGAAAGTPDPVHAVG